MANALQGSWRKSPPEPDAIAPDWSATAARLVATRAGALCWWRVRGSELGRQTASRLLYDAYRIHSLEASRHERVIAEAVDRCRAAGVEPLLAKGWAVARLYPEPGLRPYGDIDLFVRPDQRARAERALADFSGRHLTVDLHCGVPDLADRRLDDVFTRSIVETAGVMEVRVPSREDQLRHLAIHLMRHGAWRPLWLTDVAAALEAADGSFDWDYCLRGSAQRTDALVCAAGLACHILGARIDHPLLMRRARRLPPWLVPAVLSQWGSRYERLTDRPFVETLRHPREIVPALRRRWPNPIESTMSVRAPFNDVPRLPVQLADCAVRLGEFMIRLPAVWRSPG